MTNDQGQMMTIILMGVAGSGKTTVGLELARAIAGVFQDGDEFHPPANLNKMSRGEPLTDEDRQLWLERLGDAIAAGAEGEKPYILACSALKRQYRHFLAHCAQNVHFVYLKGSKDLIAKRLAARTCHFMPPSLLNSQFEVLEEPQNGLVVDIAPTPENIVAEIIRQLDLSRPQSPRQ